MSESATAKPTAPEALEATDGHANDAEAAVDPTYGITREEAEELRMLIATERDGGDMAYAAFHSLCPTGEEYAFDDKACAIYRLLEKRGLIEGADAGNGFLFFGLTQNGRDASAAYDAAHAADDEAPKPRKPALSMPHIEFNKTVVITSAATAAVVGLIAGILGAFIGNALF